MAGISKLYLSTGIELTVFYVILVVALIWGLVLHRFERSEGRSAVIFWSITALLIFADLVIRALPLYFNRIYGLWIDIPAALIRVFMFAVVVFHIYGLVKKTKKSDVSEM